MNSLIDRHAFARQSGFSMIEIMVGMVIAMLGILVMTQIFSATESQKRTTTGGDDAQNAGAIALFNLQRDLRHSGWGTSNFRMIGCDLQLRAGVTLANTAPVTINHASIPAGDANTDTLLVVSGSTNGSPEGDGITSQPAAATYAVQTPSSFTANDLVVAVPQNRPTPCSGGGRLILDRVVNTASPNVAVATGVSSMSNGTLFNLGRTLKVVVYAIRKGNLTQCDFMVNNCADASKATPTLDSTVWITVADSVVSLRAQYGRDTSTPMDSFVDANGWDQVTPSATSSSACGWSRTAAIRLALATRSGQFEKNAVTVASPTWEGTAAVTGGSTDPTAAAPIVLSSTAPGSEWQNYRYKVFQTVVPLRNISWQGAQSGC